VTALAELIVTPVTTLAVPDAVAVLAKVPLPVVILVATVAVSEALALVTAVPVV
jgi:hypothetical protein